MAQQPRITSLQALSLSVEAARDVLARCRDASELSELMARGVATLKYLRDTHAASEQVVLDAAEIMLLTGRRLGELLAEQPKHRGGRPAKTRRGARQVLTLDDLGISRDRSAKLQQLARIPDRHLRRYLGSARDSGQAPTLTAALRSWRPSVRRVAAPVGEYDCIVVDPPWPVNWKTSAPYPTMTVAEIEQLRPPWAVDCWVWCWATQRFLPDALRTVEQWGLEYSFTMTWHKTGLGRGFKPFGGPKFNSEFCIVARRGSPRFIDVTNFETCFDADTQGHSAKPDRFYDLVRRVTGGRRLDMFGRRRIPGFTRWGAEARARCPPRDSNPGDET